MIYQILYNIKILSDLILLNLILLDILNGALNLIQFTVIEIIHKFVILRDNIDLNTYTIPRISTNIS